MRFGQRGKLKPRYIGMSKIFERIIALADRLALSPSKIHNVFHVSLLKKYVLRPQRIILYQPLQIQEGLSNETELGHILDHRESMLKKLLKSEKRRCEQSIHTYFEVS